MNQEEKGIDDLRVVHVKVKGEQGILNAAIDTGAQIPVVTADVVEGQSVDNKGTIQITSAFWEHEIGELKGSNMELNDLRHGVVPVSKNLLRYIEKKIFKWHFLEKAEKQDLVLLGEEFGQKVSDKMTIIDLKNIIIGSKDYEEEFGRAQLSVISEEQLNELRLEIELNSKSVCSQEVVTDLLLRTYTQSLLNASNGDLVAVKINGSNVQTNGQDIKESKREVAFTCVFKNRILYSNRRGRPLSFQLHRPGMTDELFKGGGVGVERSINTCYRGWLVPPPLEFGDSLCGQAGQGMNSPFPLWG
ncbi:hypothetical protein TNCV_1657301 [Trichonephila clavipes]|nr:hypothetical protein TNCV_1657301 [Trichonephila clavipes]